MSDKKTQKQDQRSQEYVVGPSGERRKVEYVNPPQESKEEKTVKPSKSTSR